MGMPTYEITTTPHITPANVGRESLPAGQPSDCHCFDRRRTSEERWIVGMGMPTYSKFSPTKFSGSATPQSGV